MAKLLGGSRVPLSGSARGPFSGDVLVPGLGRGEVKRRKDGFKQLYSWLSGKDFVGVRADRREWLVVLRLKSLKRLLDSISPDGAVRIP